MAVHLFLFRNLLRDAGPQQTSVRPQTAQSLGWMLNDNKSIQTLVMKGSLERGLTFGQHLSIALPALAVNQTLTYLDLTGNEMGDIGAISLGQALRKNRSITSLFIGKINFIASVYILFIR